MKKKTNKQLLVEILKKINKIEKEMHEEKMQKMNNMNAEIIMKSQMRGPQNTFAL